MLPLQTDLLPALAADLAPSERPADLVPGLVRVAQSLLVGHAVGFLPKRQKDTLLHRVAQAGALALAALSQAQALAALRAEEKRSSAGLTSGLYKGAADLLKRSSALIVAETGSFGILSPRLLAFLAASQGLHVARCRLHQGMCLRAEAAGGAKTVRASHCAGCEAQQRRVVYLSLIPPSVTEAPFLPCP